MLAVVVKSILFSEYKLSVWVTLKWSLGATSNTYCFPHFHFDSMYTNVRGYMYPSKK